RWPGDDHLARRARRHGQRRGAQARLPLAGLFVVGQGPARIRDRREQLADGAGQPRAHLRHAGRAALRARDGAAGPAALDAVPRRGTRLMAVPPRSAASRVAAPQGGADSAWGGPALNPEPPRANHQTFLAFDFGLKRTGVASGNRITRTATPQGVIAAEGDTRFAPI